MPVCLKCNEHFPNWIKIDGKNRNLQSRKFCLSCSPRGSHNTVDLRKGTPVTEQGRLCSLCHHIFPDTVEFFYKNGNGKHSQCKSCLSKRYHKHQRSLKKEIVNYKGGACNLCGYNKCLTALEFHHLNPNEKDFNVARATQRGMPLNKLKEEADKCVLLCANCHREVHEDERLLAHIAPSTTSY